ncbi:hypothetical protein [Sorangium sp. So ce233]|uniref:hypothetical protein n=1 Tax=Sorangium sp. So ce233 TaxID=3133290 RepID=UPI003F611F05
MTWTTPVTSPPPSYVSVVGVVDAKHTALPSAVVAHGMVVPEPLLSPAHAAESAPVPGSLPPAPVVLLAEVLLVLLAPVLLVLLAPVPLAEVLLVLLAEVLLAPVLLALPAPTPLVVPLPALVTPGSPPPDAAAPPVPSSPSDDEQAIHPQAKKPSITKERFELM